VAVQAIAPVQPAERISEIDIIRGLALFGILIVNISFFKYPVFFERYPTSFSPGMDQVSAWVIQLFFTGKFYAIFSFLFGLGFYIFMDRTMKKGLELVPLYRRRLLALMAFGFIHLFFLWSGDILFNYALVGFILLRFRSKPVQAVKKWIIALFIASLLLYALLGVVNGIGESMSGPKYAATMADMIERAVTVYSGGTFLQVVSFRAVNELPYLLVSLVIWIPAVLAFFLCGLYAGKKGIFRDLSANTPYFRRIRNIGLPVGGIFLSLYFIIESGLWPLGPIARHSLLYASNYAASLFIFPVYVSVVLLALQKNFFKKLLSPLASAGRMALTNYLTQTATCIILFYGFGFGLYARVSITQGIFIALAIYLIQVVLSNIWLAWFQYGPMEWFWRVLTYKKMQPFLIRK
jgi:uncharacterized protein